MAADIELVFGVKGTTPGTATYEQIKTGLANILSDLSRDGKLQAEIAIRPVIKDLDKFRNGLIKNLSNISVNISSINVSNEALSQLRSKLLSAVSGLNLSVDAGDLKQLNSAAEAAQHRLEDLSSAGKTVGTDISTGAQKATKDLTNLKKTIDRINKDHLVDQRVEEATNAVLARKALLESRKAQQEKWTGSAQTRDAEIAAARKQDREAQRIHAEELDKIKSKQEQVQAVIASSQRAADNAVKRLRDQEQALASVKARQDEVNRAQSRSQAGSSVRGKIVSKIEELGGNVDEATNKRLDEVGTKLEKDIELARVFQDAMATVTTSKGMQDLLTIITGIGKAESGIQNTTDAIRELKNVAASVPMVKNGVPAVEAQGVSKGRTTVQRQPVITMGLPKEGNLDEKQAKLWKEISISAQNLFGKNAGDGESIVNLTAEQVETLIRIFPDFRDTLRSTYDAAAEKQTALGDAAGAATDKIAAQKTAIEETTKSAVKYAEVLDRLDQSAGTAKRTVRTEDATADTVQFALSARMEQLQHGNRNGYNGGWSSRTVQESGIYDSLNNLLNTDGVSSDARLLDMLEDAIGRLPEDADEKGYIEGNTIVQTLSRAFEIVADIYEKAKADGTQESELYGQISRVLTNAVNNQYNLEGISLTQRRTVMLEHELRSLQAVVEEERAKGKNSYDIESLSRRVYSQINVPGGPEIEEIAGKSIHFPKFSHTPDMAEIITQFRQFNEELKSLGATVGDIIHISKNQDSVFIDYVELEKALEVLREFNDEAGGSLQTMEYIAKHAGRNLKTTSETGLNVYYDDYSRLRTRDLVRLRNNIQKREYAPKTGETESELRRVDSMIGRLLSGDVTTISPSAVNESNPLRVATAAEEAAEQETRLKQEASQVNDVLQQQASAMQQVAGGASLTVDTVRETLKTHLAEVVSSTNVVDYSKNDKIERINRMFDRWATESTQTEDQQVLAALQDAILRTKSKEGIQSVMGAALTGTGGKEMDLDLLGRAANEDVTVLVQGLKGASDSAEMLLYMLRDIAEFGTKFGLVSKGKSGQYEISDSLFSDYANFMDGQTRTWKGKEYSARDMYSPDMKSALWDTLRSLGAYKGGNNYDKIVEEISKRLADIQGQGIKVNGVTAQAGQGISVDKGKLSRSVTAAMKDADAQQGLSYIKAMVLRDVLSKTSLTEDVSYLRGGMYANERELQNARKAVSESDDIKYKNEIISYIDDKIAEIRSSETYAGAEHPLGTLKEDIDAATVAATEQTNAVQQNVTAQEELGRTVDETTTKIERQKEEASAPVSIPVVSAAESTLVTEHGASAASIRDLFLQKSSEVMGDNSDAVSSMDALLAKVPGTAENLDILYDAVSRMQKSSDHVYEFSCAFEELAKTTGDISTPVLLEKMTESVNDQFRSSAESVRDLNYQLEAFYLLASKGFDMKALTESLGGDDIELIAQAVGDIVGAESVDYDANGGFRFADESVKKEYIQRMISAANERGVILKGIGRHGNFSEQGTDMSGLIINNDKVIAQLKEIQEENRKIYGSYEDIIRVSSAYYQMYQKPMFQYNYDELVPLLDTDARESVERLMSSMRIMNPDTVSEMNPLGAFNNTEKSRIYGELKASLGAEDVIPDYVEQVRQLMISSIEKLNMRILDETNNQSTIDIDSIMGNFDKFVSVAGNDIELLNALADAVKRITESARMPGQSYLVGAGHGFASLSMAMNKAASSEDFDFEQVLNDFGTAVNSVQHVEVRPLESQTQAIEGALTRLKQALETVIDYRIESGKYPSGKAPNTVQLSLSELEEMLRYAVPSKEDDGDINSYEYQNFLNAFRLSPDIAKRGANFRDVESFIDGLKQLRTLLSEYSIKSGKAVSVQKDNQSVTFNMKSLGDLIGTIKEHNRTNYNYTYEDLSKIIHLILDRYNTSAERFVSNDAGSKKNDIYISKLRLFFDQISDIVNDPKMADFAKITNLQAILDSFRPGEEPPIHPIGDRRKITDEYQLHREYVLEKPTEVTEETNDLKTAVEGAETAAEGFKTAMDQTRTDADQIREDMQIVADSAGTAGTAAVDTTTQTQVTQVPDAYSTLPQEALDKISVLREMVGEKVKLFSDEIGQDEGNAMIAMFDSLHPEIAKNVDYLNRFEETLEMIKTPSGLRELYDLCVEISTGLNGFSKGQISDRLSEIYAGGFSFSLSGKDSPLKTLELFSNLISETGIGSGFTLQDLIEKNNDNYNITYDVYQEMFERFFGKEALDIISSGINDSNIDEVREYTVKLINFLNDTSKMFEAGLPEFILGESIDTSTGKSVPSIRIKQDDRDTFDSALSNLPKVLGRNGLMENDKVMKIRDILYMDDDSSRSFRTVGEPGTADEVVVLQDLRDAAASARAEIDKLENALISYKEALLDERRGEEPAVSSADIVYNLGYGAYNDFETEVQERIDELKTNIETYETAEANIKASVDSLRNNRVAAQKSPVPETYIQPYVDTHPTDTSSTEVYEQELTALDKLKVALMEASLINESDRAKSVDLLVSKYDELGNTLNENYEFATRLGQALRSCTDFNMASGVIDASIAFAKSGQDEDAMAKYLSSLHDIVEEYLRINISEDRYPRIFEMIKSLFGENTLSKDNRTIGVTYDQLRVLQKLFPEADSYGPSVSGNLEWLMVDADRRIYDHFLDSNNLPYDVTNAFKSRYDSMLSKIKLGEDLKPEIWEADKATVESIRFILGSKLERMREDRVISKEDIESSSLIQSLDSLLNISGVSEDTKVLNAIEESILKIIAGKTDRTETETDPNRLLSALSDAFIEIGRLYMSGTSNGSITDDIYNQIGIALEKAINSQYNIETKAIYGRRGYKLEDNLSAFINASDENGVINSDYVDDISVIDEMNNALKKLGITTEDLIEISKSNDGTDIYKMNIDMANDALNKLRELNNASGENVKINDKIISKLSHDGLVNFQDLLKLREQSDSQMSTAIDSLLSEKWTSLSNINISTGSIDKSAEGIQRLKENAQDAGDAMQALDEDIQTVGQSTSKQPQIQQPEVMQTVAEQVPVFKEIDTSMLDQDRLAEFLSLTKEQFEADAEKYIEFYEDSLRKLNEELPQSMLDKYQELGMGQYMENLNAQLADDINKLESTPVQRTVDFESVQNALQSKLQEMSGAEGISAADSRTISGADANFDLLGDRIRENTEDLIVFRDIIGEISDTEQLSRFSQACADMLTDTGLSAKEALKNVLVTEEEIQELGNITAAPPIQTNPDYVDLLIELEHGLGRALGENWEADAATQAAKAALESIMPSIESVEDFQKVSDTLKEVSSPEQINQFSAACTDIVQNVKSIEDAMNTVTAVQKAAPAPSPAPAPAPAPQPAPPVQTGGGGNNPPITPPVGGGDTTSGGEGWVTLLQEIRDAVNEIREAFNGVNEQLKLMQGNLQGISDTTKNPLDGMATGAEDAAKKLAESSKAIQDLIENAVKLSEQMKGAFDPNSNTFTEFSNSLSQLKDDIKGLNFDNIKKALEDLVILIGQSDKQTQKMEETMKQVATAFSIAVKGADELVQRINEINNPQIAQPADPLAQKAAAVTDYSAYVQGVTDSIKQGIDNANQMRSADYDSKVYASIDDVLSRLVEKQNELVKLQKDYSTATDEGQKDKIKMETVAINEEVTAMKDRLTTLKETVELERNRAAAREIYDNIIKQSAELGDIVAKYTSGTLDLGDQTMFAPVKTGYHDITKMLKDTFNNLPASVWSDPQAMAAAYEAVSKKLQATLDIARNFDSTTESSMSKFNALAQIKLTPLNEQLKKIEESVGQILSSGKIDRLSPNYAQYATGEIRDIYSQAFEQRGQLNTLLSGAYTSEEDVDKMTNVLYGEEGVGTAISLIDERIRKVEKLIQVETDYSRALHNSDDAEIRKSERMKQIIELQNEMQPTLNRLVNMTAQTDNVGYESLRKVTDHYRSWLNFLHEIELYMMKAPGYGEWSGFGGNESASIDDALDEILIRGQKVNNEMVALSGRTEIAADLEKTMAILRAYNSEMREWRSLVVDVTGPNKPTFGAEAEKTVKDGTESYYKAQAALKALNDMQYQGTAVTKEQISEYEKLRAQCLDTINAMRDLRDANEGAASSAAKPYLSAIDKLISINRNNLLQVASAKSIVGYTPTGQNGGQDVKLAFTQEFEYLSKMMSGLYENRERLKTLAPGSDEFKELAATTVLNAEDIRKRTDVLADCARSTDTVTEATKKMEVAFSSAELQAVLDARTEDMQRYIHTIDSYFKTFGSLNLPSGDNAAVNSLRTRFQEIQADVSYFAGHKAPDLINNFPSMRQDEIIDVQRRNAYLIMQDLKELYGDVVDEASHLKLSNISYKDEIEGTAALTAQYKLLREEIVALREEASQIYKDPNASIEQKDSAREALTIAEQAMEDLKRFKAPGFAQMIDNNYGSAWSYIEERVQQGRDKIAGIRDEIDDMVSHIADVNKREEQRYQPLTTLSTLAETNLRTVGRSYAIAEGDGSLNAKYQVSIDKLTELQQRITDLRGNTNITVAEYKKLFQELKKELDDFYNETYSLVEETRAKERMLTSESVRRTQENITIDNLSQYREGQYTSMESGMKNVEQIYNSLSAALSGQNLSDSFKKEMYDISAQLAMVKNNVEKFMAAPLSATSQKDTFFSRESIDLVASSVNKEIAKLEDRMRAASETFSAPGGPFAQQSTRSAFLSGEVDRVQDQITKLEAESERLNGINWTSSYEANAKAMMSTITLAVKTAQDRLAEFKNMDVSPTGVTDVSKISDFANKIIAGMNPAKNAVQQLTDLLKTNGATVDDQTAKATMYKTALTELSKTMNTVTKKMEFSKGALNASSFITQAEVQAKKQNASNYNWFEQLVTQKGRAAAKEAKEAEALYNMQTPLRTIMNGDPSQNIKSLSEEYVELSGRVDAFKRMSADAFKSPAELQNYLTDLNNFAQTVLRDTQILADHTTEEAKLNATLAQGAKYQTTLDKNLTKWTSSRYGSTKGSWQQMADASAELQQLRASLSSGAISRVDYEAQFAGIKKRVSEASEEIQRAGQNTNIFGKGLQRLFSRFSYYFSAMRIFMMVTRKIREMINAVVELDTKMTDLKIVTQQSSQAYESFMRNLKVTAKEIGVNMTDLIESTTTYARLGYSLDESSTMSKLTGMLEKVGAIEGSAAQDAITSIVKAYDIGIDDLERVMDELVITGKHYCPVA